jgi:hypothetical protein
MTPANFSDRQVSTVASSLHLLEAAACLRSNLGRPRRAAKEPDTQRLERTRLCSKTSKRVLDTYRGFLKPGYVHGLLQICWCIFAIAFVSLNIQSVYLVQFVFVLLLSYFLSLFDKTSYAINPTPAITPPIMMACKAGMSECNDIGIVTWYMSAPRLWKNPESILPMTTVPQRIAIPLIENFRS